jgi:hypothetical protein
MKSRGPVLRAIAGDALSRDLVGVSFFFTFGSQK